MFVHIAANIRRARAYARGEAGGELTQRELAFAIGTDPQMLARWERGDTQINAGHLKLIADFFHVPVDDFYEAEPKYIKPPQGAAKVPAPKTAPTPAEPSRRPSRPAHRG